MTERDLFLAALDDADPAGYVDRACADPEVRARVLGLLGAHQASGAFMDRPAAGATVSYADPTGDLVGSRIGPYKLLEQVGEGGFGVVYMAEQVEPVRRKVALKVLKAGMDSKQVVARFEAERQALALMDHPNIARVFDGGQTAAGLPYFVMELVRGVPLTEFCDKNRLPVRARLDLFVHICRAVQHAHQKGVIHRDLKPANVLVTLHDGVPVPKVIDFGVAKAIGQQLTDKTLFTGLAQMVGTPLYMSPEQAEMSGLDVDTRSDIYSLGVLLYELLTGTTPFDRERLRTAGLDEVRRIIREEEPARPSTRLSTLGQIAITVSANRGSDPLGLRRLVRGELDWIVMRALEKDRTRRYETPGAFAADIQRYLADEPVLACPPSAGYRFRKFARRHTTGLAAAGLLAATVATVIVVLAVSILRISREKWGKEVALGEKVDALAAADEQLFQSLVHQARAGRTSGRIGQRFDTLAAVRRAAEIRVTPELRTEAAAALLLPDVEVDQQWAGWPAGTVGVSFDAAFDRFARLDDRGDLAVYRLVAGREELVAPLPGTGTPRYTFVRMSPDGRAVAVGHSTVSVNGADAVRVWKIDDPADPVPINVPGRMYPWAIHFAPDGRRVAVGDPDGPVRVLDLTSRVVKEVRLGPKVTAVAFHPKDGRVAAACQTGVYVFDPERDDPPRRLAAVRDVFTLAWRPDGRRLAGGGESYKVHVWDADTGAEVMPPLSHPARGLRVAYNATGDRLLSVGWGAEAYLWDAAGGRLLLKIPGVEAEQFGGPGDDRLGLGRDRERTTLWRLAAGRELRTLRRAGSVQTDRVYNPVVDPTGRVVAAGVVDPTGRVVAADAARHLAFFDLETGEELAAPRLSRPLAALPIAYDPAGGWITAGYAGVHLWPSRLRPRPGADALWEVGPPTPLAPGLDTEFSSRASASADARVVAVPLGREAVVIHRGRPGPPVRLAPQYDLRFAAVSPDGQRVVTGSHTSDGRSAPVRVYNAATGRVVDNLRLRDPADIAYSPNGRWLLTVGGDGTRLWATDEWREVRGWARGGYAFSPDPENRMLAVGDTFGVVRLTETETGREVARLTLPEPLQYAPAAFTPDGAKLIATGVGGPYLYVVDLRAVRRQLAELRLDWEGPAFDPPGPPGRPFGFAADAGNLSDAATVPRTPAEYRDRIARLRGEVAAPPDNPTKINNLAWFYLTAPPPHRDWRAALPLAEKAVSLRPVSGVYANTLGLAYYRAGRYRKAIDTLRPNIARQLDPELAYDLYFLAMSHAQLGEAARARDYYDWADRWTRAQAPVPPRYLQESAAIRAEAADALGIAREPE
jgi:serine/threonine protein kinase/WD40 repeat protein